MYTLGFTAQKGGSGKTTTAVNLAVAIEQKGHRCLVVDIDHQANATYWMLGRMLRDREPGLFEVLVENEPIRSVIQETDLGPDLAPTSPKLVDLQTALREHTLPQDALRQSLEPIGRASQNGSDAPYGFCLVDPPANLDIRLMMTMRACDGVIVPIVPEGFSIQGLGQVFDTIRRVQEEGLNPGLEVVGLLANQLDVRRNLTSHVMDALEGKYGDRLFETRIRQRTNIAEAPSDHSTLEEIAPDRHGDRAYRDLADEVIERIQQ